MRRRVDRPVDRPSGPAGGPADGGADGHAAAATLSDDHGEAWQRYGARDGTVFVIRPDGYILGRWGRFDAARIIAALAPFRAPIDPSQPKGAEALPPSDRSASPSGRANAEST